MSHIVFDIGGTHLRVARLESGAPSEAQKIETPASPDEAFTALVALAGRVAGGTVDGISGGVAGVIGKDGTVLSSPNLPEWNGFPLARKLSERFSAPAFLHNDSDLAGLGEALFGAGQGARIVAHLRLGTGVGGTRIVEGEIDDHAQGFEPGHQVVELSTGASLESLIGGAALRKKYGMPPPKLSPEIWKELTPALAIGIWNAIVHWSPDIVVLGGSLFDGPLAFQLDEVRASVEQCRRVLPTVPPIVLGTLDDRAGLYGAAALLPK